MSEVGPTIGFLSIVMEVSTQGLDVVDPLRDAFARLTPAMFAGDEQQLFEAARTLLDEGTPPPPLPWAVRRASCRTHWYDANSSVGI